MASKEPSAPSVRPSRGRRLLGSWIPELLTAVLLVASTYLFGIGRAEMTIFIIVTAFAPRTFAALARRPRRRVARTLRGRQPPEG